jgi:Aspartyl protease/Domain of unknown function (DUF4124)
MLRRPARAALLALAILAAPAVAWAQLYRWVNEQGEVHLTQGLENVPERFRAGARLLGYPEAAPDRPAPTAASTAMGGARIPFVPGSPILVTMRINGLRTVRLVLDTGADTTLIHPSALAAAGVDPGAGRPYRLEGVTGAGDGRQVTLDSLEVGDARVAPLTVVAYYIQLREGDGLLGRDFLDRFRMSVDGDARLVILAPR